MPLIGIQNGNEPVKGKRILGKYGFSNGKANLLLLLLPHFSRGIENGLSVLLFFSRGKILLFAHMCLDSLQKSQTKKRRVA